MVGRPGFGLALFPVRSEDPKPRPGPDVLAIRHVAFRVTGEHFARAQAALTVRGEAFEFQDHEVSQSIYLTDPDGHEIELTTYVAESTSRRLRPFVSASRG
jgi:catechol-2,3-dioxygenase